MEQEQKGASFFMVTFNILMTILVIWSIINVFIIDFILIILKPKLLLHIKYITLKRIQT